MPYPKHLSFPRVAALAAPLLPILSIGQIASAQMITATENFNVDPAWDGHNNRSTLFGPAAVTQNYGYSSNRVGGTINPTGEISYFAQAVSNSSFNTPLTASGTITNNGGGNSWLGFFNSATANEWRSANSLSLRIYGRGNHFLAYPEYGTSTWRAGADGFVSGGNEVQFPTNTALNWSLAYDPTGNGGGGTITAIINGQTSVKNLDPGHKLDGAIFNRFGLGAVNKSWDSPGNLFIDNVNVNGAGAQTFTGSAPGWSGVNNNATYSTNNVRFRFDFGHSPTNNAGGTASGEAGGNFFRGDSRQAETMAFYGDQLAQALTLNQPLHAHGKVSFHRGVTDSTVHLGFFHDTDSVRVSQAQAISTPENFVGVTIEGPSAEGFFFYPSYNSDAEGEGSGGNRGIVTPPYIYPDGMSHNWTFDYNPNGNGGAGQIVISLDGQQAIMNLTAAHRSHGAQFNRFGFITPHIDGNGQTVFIDDVTYTVGFGASQQWMPDASDDWHIASNWAGAAGAVAPNGIGASALFGNNNTAPRTVFLNAPTTLGTLSFSSPTSWLLSGLGSLTMQVASGTAQINITQGTHKINLPMIIASNTSVTLFGGSQLVISDPVTVNAGRTLTHTGTGSVVYQSTFTIGSGGSVVFDSAAQLESLAIAPDATAQVGGSLVVKRGDFDAIAGKVKQGFNGGDWRGGGITSPAAADDPHGARAIGVVDNAALRLSAFAGFDSLSGNEVLLRETWSGDADLSGVVDVSDFDRFLLGFDDSNTAATWVTGDFDFSGVVDALDFEHFLLGLKYQPDPPITSDLLGALHAFVAREGLDVDLSSVPEPASIGLLALGAGALGRRHRHKT